MAEAQGHSSPATIDFGANRYKTIFRLALPTVFAMLLQSAVNEVDDIFFGHLPCPPGGVCEASNAQGALLPSLLIVWLFGGSLGAISVGTQAYTARRIAEGKKLEAGAVLMNAIWFTLLGGIVFTILARVLMPVLLGVMIEVEPVRKVAIEYTQYRLLGILSMAITMAIKGFFDGIGKTQLHFVASLVMNVANVIMCWAFIFGHLGVPRMGAPGAGLAGFLSTWIGLFIMLGYAWAYRTEYAPLRWSNLSRRLTWDMLRLSIPAAAATIVMMLGFGLFTRIVSGLDAPGTEPVAGASTTNIIEILKLTFTACIAFGTATATLVSQSLGAKRPDDAARFAWSSVRLGLILFGVVGLLEGFVLRSPLLSLFSTSTAVREAMQVPMMMMGFVTPVIAVALILSEALFGAGNSRFVAIAQFLLVFGVLVPLAWFLGTKMGMGIMGIWTSGAVYAALASAVMAIKFRGGAWKKIVI
jgi:putative MATE family efflux protein